MSPDSSTGHRVSEIRFVAKFGENQPLQSCRKNSRSVELVPAPIFAKMGRSRPKFPECCHPLTSHTVYRLWSRSTGYRWTYSRATGNSRSGIPGNLAFPAGIPRNFAIIAIGYFFPCYFTICPVSLPFTTITECKLQRIKY